MKKQLFLFSFLLIFIAAALGAQSGVDLQIRFYDKQVYYTDSPVLIKVELLNNSAETFRFKLADIRSFSLDFTVRTLQNEPLAHAPEFVLERNTNQRIFFREITLPPGESYSFIQELNRYIQIAEPRQLIVQAHFYPELFTDRAPQMITSNTLSLSVRPAAPGVSLPVAIDEETAAILRAEALNPDEVVSYMIRARQMEQWDKYFLYLDLEALFLRNPGNEARFRASSEADRISMVNQYKEQLRSQTIDYDILLVPQEFRILKTTYTEEEGEVAVLMKIRYPDFTELKQYTYELQKKRGIWYITDYNVRNLGTE